MIHGVRHATSGLAACCAESLRLSAAVYFLTPEHCARLSLAQCSGEKLESSVRKGEAFPHSGGGKAAHSK